MRPELCFAHPCGQTPLIRHSPSNAHAYRLLVFKEHRSTHQTHQHQKYQGLKPFYFLSPAAFSGACDYDMLFKTPSTSSTVFFTAFASQTATDLRHQHL
jgi:hypothetical protein